MINSLSAFAVEGSALYDIVTAAVLTLVAIAYAVYIIKKVPSKADLEEHT